MVFSVCFKDFPRLHQCLKDGKRTCHLKTDCLTLFLERSAGINDLCHSSLCHIDIGKRKNIIAGAADRILCSRSGIGVTIVQYGAHRLGFDRAAERQKAKVCVIMLLYGFCKYLHGFTVHVSIRKFESQT